MYNIHMPKGKPKLKTAVMSLRMEPYVKEVAELAARKDRRSVASLIEVLVLDHGKRLGIEPSNQVSGSENETEKY